MVKILYVISSLEDCGPVRVLYNIIRHMDCENYNIGVLAFSPASNRDMFKNFEGLGVKVQVFHVSRLKMLWQRKKILQEFIEEFKPDVIHTQCFRSTLFMKEYRGISKLCTTIHCVFFQDFELSYGNLKGKIMTYIYANSLAKYDLCIACSKSVENFIKDRYRLKLNSIRNGIQIPVAVHIDNKEKCRTERARLDLPTDKKIFIFSGKICEGKNQIFLLKSLDKCKVTDVCIVFLGDGPKMAEYRKYESSQFIFKGNVNNVCDYLAIADGFVSASLSEGMPNAVLEALMMGLPCVLSNIESHLEIYHTYSNGCWIFDLKNPNDLVDKLNQVCSTLLNESDVHTNIANQAKELFSSEIMSRKYQDIYKRLLRN